LFASAIFLPTVHAADPTPTDPRPFTLVVHGGSGTITRTSITPKQEAKFRASLERALKAGHEVLSTGGTSVDAVVATIKVFEDDPLFNAGKGAVFTSAGKSMTSTAPSARPRWIATAISRREPPPAASPISFKSDGKPVTMVYKDQERGQWAPLRS
jgi:hypothetical protein